MNIEEISKKYNVSISEEKEKDYNSIPITKNMNELVFEMTEQEVMYPIDDKDNKQIIVLSLTKIIPQVVEQLSEFKDKAKKLWQNNVAIENGIKNFTEFANNYDGSKNHDSYKVEERTFDKHQEVENKELPDQLLKGIFLTKIHHNTDVVRLDNKVYFAYIKQIYSVASKDDKKDEERVNISLKNLVMEELVNYFIKENKVRVNEKLLPRYES